jgi:hydrogenase expression/formation protein HypC
MCLGVPGKITKIYDKENMKMCEIDFGGVTREACLDFIPEAKVGEYVIIHVGFAITLLSEEEAMETLNLLREISDLDEELGVEQTEDIKR